MRTRSQEEASLDELQSRAEISLHCICSEHGVVRKDIHIQFHLGNSRMSVLSSEQLNIPYWDVHVTKRDDPAFAGEVMPATDDAACS